ncbi:hypothetical protein [Niabella drilacis]|uniref:DUF4136 domain-containing protein n=1 Tax=Niabella drilacis (strain DSM 25811 / CCM 8410 / CCUG 62505 / LMG 26954 / E90) TaxID=1285928 RepID=A0A1G6TRW0_NIADE|nr:hypothetical protein [Niabella drilacis]SDD31838.1 hypothetical protein SAMN04487894_10810 [Niabella drilacis]
MRIKIILISLLAGAVSCGSHNSTRVSVTDRNGALRIQVQIQKGWRNVVNYDRSFPNAGMNKEQRDVLVRHILDSLKQE